MVEQRQIKITTDYIRLDQLLKWVGLASSGSEAKFYIETGQVEVNQTRENRRGRKIYPGDVVKIGDSILRISNGG